MKMTQTVYLYARPDYFEPEKMVYAAFSIADMEVGSSEYTRISSADVTFDVPEAPDSIALAIDVIDRKKLAALQAYHKEVAALNERLAKLQALTNDAHVFGGQP
jgi:hypothetical protein